MYSLGKGMKDQLSGEGLPMKRPPKQARTERKAQLLLGAEAETKEIVAPLDWDLRNPVRP